MKLPKLFQKYGFKHELFSLLKNLNSLELQHQLQKLFLVSKNSMYLKERFLNPHKSFLPDPMLRVTTAFLFG